MQNAEPQERETWNECCPWCGRSVQDLSDYSIGEMFFEFDCPHCEQPIKAMRQTVVEYRFVPNWSAVVDTFRREP
jgi:hypothetical protein